MNNIIRVRSQESGVRPVVSFCIPVYNNAEAAQKIVNSLLVSDDTRFEVIVTDDASTDNAQEILSQIHDPRFRYYRNDKNLGPHKNWEHALELGKGVYLFLSMMRDRLYGDKITHLIEILERAHRENITLLQDGYDTKHDYKVYDGIDAMIRFLKTWHPTATIFDGDIFHSIPNRTRYFEISDMYPENYIRRDCLLKGKGASIVSGIYSREGDFYYRNSHSTVEYGGPVLDTYYAPRRGTIHAFELIDMVEVDLPGLFPEDGINRYFKGHITKLMRGVSIGWYTIGNIGSEYYGQPPIKVTMRDAFMNIIDAYHNTEAHLKEKGIFTPAKHRIMYICMVKTMVRTFRYVIYMSVKRTAKKILTPLGIWKILHNIKHSRRKTQR